MAAEVDLGGCISSGVEKLKANPMYAILGLLVAMIVGSIPFGLLIGPMMVGYLRGLDKGKDAKVGDVFDGFKTLVPALLHAIVGYIAVLIAFMLLFIPGLIVAPMWMLGFVHLAKNPDAGFPECFMKGKDLVMSNLVMSIVCLLVFGIVGGIGGILFGIGALITYPIALGAWLTLYSQLDGGAAAAPAEAEAAAE